MKSAILPLCVLALMASACGDDDGFVVSTNQARVRFVNAITGVSGNVGFTVNNNFFTTSSVAFGTASVGCETVTPGVVPVAFGPINTTGNGIGTVLVTADQNLNAGGQFTVIAAGTSANPHLFLLVENFGGVLNANQGTLRFVNLIPTAVTAHIDVIGTSISPDFLTDITFSGSNPPLPVTAGTITFSIRSAAGTNLITNQSVTVAAGTRNTVAIMPTPSGGFQALHVRGC